MRPNNRIGEANGNGERRGFISTVIEAAYVWVMESVYIGCAYMSMGWENLCLMLGNNCWLWLRTNIPLGWALARVAFIDPMYHSVAQYFLHILQPFFDWWDGHNLDAMFWVSIFGCVSTLITIYYMDKIPASLFVISPITSIILILFSVWAYMNVEDARKIWWLHQNFGVFVSWITNSTMLLVGIFVGRWTETSWASICFFTAMAVWFLSLLYLVRPPTDFGVLVFFLTCLLNQVLRFYGIESDIIFIYWLAVVVFLGLTTIFNPHAPTPVPEVAPPTPVPEVAPDMV